MDIQNLHTVDITYGSAYGDQVLAEAASVISSRLRAQDLLFAYRADQLVLLFDHYEAQRELEDFANDILAQFGSDKELADIQHVNLAIGIVEVTDSHLSVDKLLQNASLALEAVPEDAKRPFRFFSAEMEAIVQREDRIEKALREVFKGKKKRAILPQFPTET